MAILGNLRLYIGSFRYADHVVLFSLFVHCFASFSGNTYGSIIIIICPLEASSRKYGNRK